LNPRSYFDGLFPSEEPHDRKACFKPAPKQWPGT
jgi:hypothetical protein